RWGRRTMAISSNAIIPRWIGAAALGHLGRIDEARVEIGELLARHPQATLARARNASFRHEWMYDLYLDGLRKAGLREEEPAQFPDGIAALARGPARPIICSRYVPLAKVDMRPLDEVSLRKSRRCIVSRYQ